MSVSVPSPTAEHALSIFRAHCGVLKTKSAMELGIHPRTLYALRDAGRLERLDRGLYRIADGKPLENPDLVTVALKVPKGVGEGAEIRNRCISQCF